jgi:hypothetical protein
MAAGIGAMIYFIGGYLLLCAAGGGFWGWYRGTRRLRRRPHHIDRPDLRQRIAVLRRQRVFATAAYAAMGVPLGLALLLFVAHRV